MQSRTASVARPRRFRSMTLSFPPNERNRRLSITIARLGCVVCLRLLSFGLADRLRVEKGGRGGGEDRRRKDVVMRESRQDGEPGIRYSRPIPAAVLLAAAEQLEELHGVGSADRVGVAEYQQRRRLDRGHLLRPVVVLPQQVA